MRTNSFNSQLVIFLAGSLLGIPAFAICEQEPSSFTQTHEVMKQARDQSLCAVAQKMDVQGHRGMEGYPNNTLASFRASYAAGSDTVELDLQITSDDRVLVAHDPTLDPKRCGLVSGQALEKLAIRQMNLAQAKAVQCAETTLSPSAAKAPMPELAEVFKEFKTTKTRSGQPAQLNIEIKYDAKNPQYFPPPKEYVKKIIEVIRQGGWSQGRMIVQSFDHHILKLVKEQAPDLEIVPLVGDATEAVKAAKELGSRTVTPSFTQLTPEIVSELHAMKVKAIAWTPDREEEMLKVIATGADGIITNRPDLFLKLRERLCGR